LNGTIGYLLSKGIINAMRRLIHCLDHGASPSKLIIPEIVTAVAKMAQGSFGLRCRIGLPPLPDFTIATPQRRTEGQNEEQKNCHFHDDEKRVPTQEIEISMQ